MTPHIFHKESFFGGTVLGVLSNLPVEDVFVTIIMAVIGAVASFIVSVVLKYISRKFGK